MSSGEEEFDSEGNSLSKSESKQDLCEWDFNQAQADEEDRQQRPTRQQQRQHDDDDRDVNEEEDDDDDDCHYLV